MSHLPEKELTHTFINSLEEPFFSHLIEHTSVSFSEIVLASSRIENALLSGKLPIQEGFDSKTIPEEGAMINMMNSGNYIKPT